MRLGIDHSDKLSDTKGTLSILITLAKERNGGRAL